MLSNKLARTRHYETTAKQGRRKGLGSFSLLTYTSISVISAFGGPENLPSIPLKNVKQTNKQQQEQKQNSKKGAAFQ